MTSNIGSDHLSAGAIRYEWFYYRRKSGGETRDMILSSKNIFVQNLNQFDDTIVFIIKKDVVPSLIQLD